MSCTPNVYNWRKKMSTIFIWIYSSLFFNTFPSEISFKKNCNMWYELNRKKQRKKHCHYHFEMNIADLYVNTLFADVGDSFFSRLFFSSLWLVVSSFSNNQRNGKAIIALDIYNLHADVEGKLRLKHDLFNLWS